MNNNKFKLYNSVWSNIVLKKIILFHLTIFNLLYRVDIEFESFEQWQNFKNKQYLYSIKLWSNYYQELNHELPENIKLVYLPSIPPFEYEDHVISILNHVDSIIFSNACYIQDILSSKNFFKSKLKSLILLDQQIPPYSLPQSIVGLKILGKIALIKNVLPMGLQKLSLKFARYGVISFENGCLPIESLTHVELGYSIPSVINQLSLSLNLIKLEYSNMDQYIDSSILFPNSLQYLILECKYLNTKLPINLKSLKLNMKTYQYEIQFPSSLEYISVCFKENQLEQNLFLNYQLVPPNLISLEIPYISIIGNDGNSILPNKLKTLIIGGFNQALQINQLPSSLTCLYLKNEFNQIIDINVLPPNLKTLRFGDQYSQLINPLAIPQNLQLLHIDNDSYSYPIQLTPSTHPYTKIKFEALNLYYNPNDSQLRVLRLPQRFNSPLSILKLKDKSNLEYLHLGCLFNYKIQLSDLPIENNIKTLELSISFTHCINLDHFQNLETIIISLLKGNKQPSIITTTTITNNNDSNNNDNNSIITYNFYKLKNIIVSSEHNEFIKQLDSNFYQFIKIKD